MAIKTDCMELELDSTSWTDRKEWVWTDRNEARSEDIARVLQDHKAYWPLTLRQLYYRLISDSCIEGKHWHWNGGRVDVYKAIVRTAKWMRIEGRIPMRAIKDDHRTLTTKRGYEDMQDFISDRLDFSFFHYSRCLAQDQPRYIEVWLEKSALLGLVEPVADEFCRRVMVCRGYNSITFQAGFYHRARKALELEQVPTVLYFGDWDPSGVNMIYAAMQTMEEELYLDGVEYYRCGINPSHFQQIHAVEVPIKPSDSRTRRFVRNYGSTAYELDAFHPEQLKQLVRQSIQHFTDMEIFDAQKSIEEKELDHVMEMDEKLEELKAEIEIIGGNYDHD